LNQPAAARGIGGSANKRVGNKMAVRQLVTGRYCAEANGWLPTVNHLFGKEGQAKGGKLIQPCTTAHYV